MGWGHSARVASLGCPLFGYGLGELRPFCSYRLPPPWLEAVGLPRWGLGVPSSAISIARPRRPPRGAGAAAARVGGRGWWRGWGAGDIYSAARARFLPPSILASAPAPALRARLEKICPSLQSENVFSVTGVALLAGKKVNNSPADNQQRGYNRFKCFRGSSHVVLT